MFLGALVKAYSRPVMDAKISLNAMRTYLVRMSELVGVARVEGRTYDPDWIQTLSGET